MLVTSQNIQFCIYFMLTIMLLTANMRCNEIFTVIIHLNLPQTFPSFRNGFPPTENINRSFKMVLFLLTDDSYSALNVVLQFKILHSLLYWNIQERCHKTEQIELNTNLFRVSSAGKQTVQSYGNVLHNMKSPFSQKCTPFTSRHCPQDPSFYSCSTSLATPTEYECRYFLSNPLHSSFSQVM
jgi:hypothetical protein